MVADVLRKNPRLLRDAAESITAIPSGAVMAFDLGKCPTYWSRIADADGRMVVGVGQGIGLTSRGYHELGGKDIHSLTIAELPPHKHSGTTLGGNKLRLIRAMTNQGGEIHPAHIIGFAPGSSTDWHNTDQYPFSPHTHDFESDGGKGLRGVPHDNMPPYIALYFCKKD